MSKVYIEGIAMYARVKEGSEDTGTNLPEGSDQRNKLEETKGRYVMNLMVTPEAKKQAIADGIPNTGMTGQLWKEDQDGNPFYKCSKKVFNPKFTNKDTGEQGVYMGPPKVLKVTDEGNVEWDWETDGLIGNGSEVTVKFDVWDGKIVEMEAILVREHVPYDGNTNEHGF